MARNHVIRVRFNREEKETIKRRADALCMKPATFLRVVGVKSILQFAET